MREIGGFLGLDRFKGEEYYDNLIRLNNGTNAVHYMAEARGMEKIYIPHYLCSSVETVLRKNGYRYDYYEIGSDFEPKFKDNLGSREYIYIVNFYGQISNEKAIELKEKYGNIVFDNAHAFYQRPVKGIDTIYSCRKFFGVPDGAYLSTDAKLERVLDTDVSRDRMKHVIGSYEGRSSEFYVDYRRVEDLLDYEELKYMSKLTENILRAIDYDGAKLRRIENYRYLDENIGEMNRLDLKEPLVPFMYPLYVDNGELLRKELIRRKVFIPTFWDSVMDKLPEGRLEHKYSKDILPIPCDQRYGLDEMKYLVEVLKCIG